MEIHGWRIWTPAESFNEGMRVEAKGGKFLSFAQAAPLDRWVFILFIIIYIISNPFNKSYACNDYSKYIYI
jgi:hypothetical protein